MGKKKIIGILAIISIIVGVGKLIMDKRAENEREASIKIQTQVADQLYRYYRLYTENKKKNDILKKKYDNGKGMTTDEYLKESLNIRDYEPIKKIEFTNIYIDAKGKINLDFIINGVYEDSAFLASIDFDRNDWSYQFDDLNNIDGYYLDEKERATSKPISKNQITFYKGRIK